MFTVPGVGLTPTEAPSKDYLGKALAVAKNSTASIGKFTESLPKEKPQKNMGRKRKVNVNFLMWIKQWVVMACLRKESKKV